MDIIQILILGIVQGISEWLPISSKTLDAFVFLLLGGQASETIYVLLYLHLGTLLAAAAYFHKQIIGLAKELFKIRKISDFEKSQLKFYISALFGTALVALPLLAIQSFLFPSLSANLIFLLMGAGLLVTSIFLFLRAGKVQVRMLEQANGIDGLFTGIMQGLSVIPGISRSGAGTTALFWRKFRPEAAFELCFILSIPTVLGAEMLFYFLDSGFAAFNIFDGLLLAGSSFLFGYITIGVLLDFAKKTNLALLAAAFGIIMIIAGFIGIS